MNYLNLTLVIGLTATMVMDFWGYARKPWLGIPAADYRLVGRWVWHLSRGRFQHESIAESPPVRREVLAGWAAHYFLGWVFAAGLLAIVGTDWVRRPTLAPALAFGMVTVLVPVLVMQPAMGMPRKLRLQSLLTHAVFGLGLYAGGWAARGLLEIDVVVP